METGNVLVIGNSGVGKSTLINAFLDEDEITAKVGWGISGTTDALEIYPAKKVPFRLIDTIGFEPSFLKRTKAIKAVKKWSKESAKENKEDRQINAIWFCIDGTSRKLFPDAIKNLSKATKMWESVPVIVVITKSYSIPERAENVQMVHNAFAQQKRYAKNLKAVIPVVAQTYTLNDAAFAPPEGIMELIDATNAVMPEGLKAAEKDIASFKLKRKRAISQSIISTATAAGGAVGAIPLPIADAAILIQVEGALVVALRKVYEIPEGDDTQKIVDIILEVGTASVAAKAAISALKAIPGVNLAVEVINTIVAAAIVAAIGEGSAYIFEKIYLGEMSTKDSDKIRKFIEEKLNNEFIGKVTKIIEDFASSERGKNSLKDLAGRLIKVLGPSNIKASS
jgi:uncharacterized protein (DUF697 family)/GTP-binding protein EngB required for normal cell division